MRSWIKRMEISNAQYIKEDMSGVYYEQHATKFKAIKAKLDRDNILKSFEQLMDLSWIKGGTREITLRNMLFSHFDSGVFEVFGRTAWGENTRLKG